MSSYFDDIIVIIIIIFQQLQHCRIIKLNHIWIKDIGLVRQILSNIANIVKGIVKYFVAATGQTTKAHTFVSSCGLALCHDFPILIMSASGTFLTFTFTILFCFVYWRLCIILVFHCDRKYILAALFWKSCCLPALLGIKGHSELTLKVKLFALALIFTKVFFWGVLGLRISDKLRLTPRGRRWTSWGNTSQKKNWFLSGIAQITSPRIASLKMEKHGSKNCIVKQNVQCF